MQSSSRPKAITTEAAVPRRRTRVGRPMSRPVATRDGRRWPWLSWPVSVALFAIPFLLLVGTVAARQLGGVSTVVLAVADRATGESVAGAQVVGGDRSWSTDAAGNVTVPTADGALALEIRGDGYQSERLALEAGATGDHRIDLRPTTLVGRLSDAATGDPIPDARVSAETEGGGGAPVAAEPDGSFRLVDVPEGARLRVEAGDYGVREEAIADRTRIDLALPLAVVTGAVRDASGAPVAGATVATTDGVAVATSDADGGFRLVGPTGETEVLVSAPGYGDLRLAARPGAVVEAALESRQIKAVYANLSVLTDRTRLDRLIEIAETTEVNAIVVDVKQDTIYYDTQVAFFRDVPGMVTPSIDPAALVAELEERGIYTIARMVVFKDPVVAEGRPDLAVKDEVKGGLWRDMNGAAWVNAFNQELWQANADLAVELAGFGFDEIQYDYIRFPSDGDLRTADFGDDYSEEARRAAISGAVKLASERLRPTGAKFAIDLFPIIALFGNDQGIGQTLQDLTPLVDYVCLMVYPSHYAFGNIPVDGHPNDFPAETVTYTLEQAEAVMPGSKAKMRPWLQDFTYPAEGFSAYGPDEVRAQIEAAEAWGASGWLLWNAAGEFEVEALAPE